jgi:hypothetical protein
MTAAQWRAAHIEHIRRLAAPTDHQRLLLLLADTPNRSALDEKKLNALLTQERKLQLLGTQLLRTRLQDKSAARRARNHHLIQLGGLVAKAGLGDWDKGTLLGGLMEISHAEPVRQSKWKVLGDGVLATSPTRPKND